MFGRKIQRIKNVVRSIPFVNKLFVLSGCILLASIAVVNSKIPVYTKTIHLNILPWRERFLKISA